MKAIRMDEATYDRLQNRKDKGNVLPTSPLPDPPATTVPSKYRNRATGGYASAKEARRAEALRLLQASGAITNLREQVPFIVIPEQRGEDGKIIEHPCRYVADFVYIQQGKEIVEDTKGLRTAEYRIKRKLMLLVHKIRILES